MQDESQGLPLVEIYSHYGLYNTRQERTDASYMLSKDPKQLGELLEATLSRNTTLAPTDVATLLQFANDAIIVEQTEKLVHAQADLLVQCLETPRDRLAVASLARTRNSVGQVASKFGPERYLKLLDSPNMAGLAVTALLADVSHSSPCTYAAAVEASLEKWASGFVKIVLALKTAPPVNVIAAFAGYFRVMTQAVWDSVLVPAIARTLLRAAEMILLMFPAIFSMLPKLNFDTASSSFQSSLTSSLGSSNPLVRQAAARGLELCLDRSQVLAEPVIAGFTKATGESRILYAQVLLHIDAQNEAAAKAVGVVAAKETSETTLPYIVEDAVHFKCWGVIAHGAADKKKPLLRREWVCAAATEPTEQTKGALVTALDDVLANPIQAISTRFIVAGYAATAALESTSGLELLKDPKIYERLSTKGEFRWALRAVTVLACPEITNAIVYLCAHACHELRLEVNDALKHVYSIPNVAPALAESVEALHESSSRIMSVFGTPNQFAEQALVKLLVVAHNAKLKDGWTGLCLKAGIDPGKLVNTWHKEMVDKIWAAPTHLMDAANAALATIAFISPGAVTPLVVDLISSTLQVVPISSDEQLVYETPENEIALTAEVKKKNQKQAKQKGDVAWDEQIRQELAKKNAAAKLSPEDKAIIDEQVKVKEHIKGILSAYERAITAINSLSCSHLENGINQWYPVAVTRLLQVSRMKIADSARECLLGLARNVSSRFGDDIRRKIGTALLWRLRLSEVGNAEMLNEVLYRAKFLADQQPIDRISLIYLLPVLIAIIKESSNLKAAASEELEEQLLLALNIVATEADELDSIPRQDLIISLIDLLEKNVERAKDVKDCLQRVAQGVVFNKQEQAALLTSTVNANSYVRTASLEVIDAEVDLRSLGFSPEIFIERFGEEAPLAHTIWQESEMHVPEDAVAQIVGFLGHDVRSSVAKAIAYVVTTNEKLAQPTVDILCSTYNELRKPPKVQLDEFGMEIRQKVQDPWQKRSGCLQSLTLLVSLLNKSQTMQVANFVAENAVSDPNSDTVSHAHELGLQIVEVNGAQFLDDLLPLFSSFVEKEAGDEQVRQAHIMLYGMEARHLPVTDTRLASIVQRLIDALDTPSEKVQFSISGCIVPLAKRVNPQPYLEKLLERVFSAPTTTQRKGAAYGISGLAKGTGISSLSDYGVVRAIFEGSDDKRDPVKREGAQLLIECLSLTLNKLFEPYALELLPIVLGGLGDSQPSVRAAATGAARTVMKYTTGYGIKLQIPMALDRMNDTAWRSKKGAVELLGTMAYLDPQQLSSSLSTIVPEIVSVLGDTHKEVRAAAKGSLQSFGEVIKNPEIHEIVPALLDAISDPTKNTEAALDALLKTKFVHYIDTPSLAIVIHVLKRGLRDRSANTKRRSCQVVGNMSILTEPADLIPYLPEIMPDLQVAMVDPVPATCSTACKALGVLVEKLGEGTFPQVIPDMVETLKDPSKVSDRWGVAQGLSEVIHGLGISKLEEMLPTILKNCSSPKPWIRQAFVPLLLFLPSSFGQAITPYLSELTPAVLKGLADNLDDVRENALKAGRRIVRNFAARAVDLLLPELEAGLSDTNYRIRLSSVELTGDLLFQLSGVTKNQSEDAIVSSRVQAALTEILGTARRDRILSLIFICRADVVGAVRSSALEVWMTLVANTPRTVKEILPTLSQLIVKRLSDVDDELQKIAAKALGELVRRVNGALQQLLPTFVELSAADPESKEGICIGLIELIQSTPFEVLKDNERDLTKLIRSCLTDLNDSVREAASQAFDSLQEALGEVAQDILPDLIAQMEQGDDGAFAALKEMMSTSPDVVFPALLPKLISAPITPFKANSLADICDVAGQNLYKRIDSIVDVLLAACEQEEHEGEIAEQINEAFSRILLVCAPLSHLLHVLKNEQASKRRTVLRQLATVFAQDHSQIDMLFIPEFVSLAVLGLDDAEHENVLASFEFLRSIVEALTKAQLAELVDPAYKALSQTAAPVAGFRLPKGISCILPIFLQGLVLGSNKVKETSALAIAAVVERTEPEHVKPSVTAIAGPLIRVVGEKYPGEVKAAIVYCLNVLLTRISQFLRPFLPQLQRTFAKCLADPSSSLLRDRAAKSLGTLITLQPRLEPLVKEILVGIETATDAGVTKSMLRAMLEIVSRAGENLSEPTQQSIVDMVTSEAIECTDMRQLELLSKIGAILLGLLGGRPDLVTRFETAEPLFALMSMNAVLVYAPDVVPKLNGLVDRLVTEASDPNHGEQAVSGLAKYALGEFPVNEDVVSTLMASIGKDESRSGDTRRLALIALRGLARQKPLVLSEDVLEDLVVPLFACVRDTVVPVKLAAENTFLDVYRFIETGDAAFFNQTYERAVAAGKVPEQYQRSLGEYVRRVAMRHTAARREQIEAGTTDNDMSEDLAEVMSIGPIEVD